MLRISVVLRLLLLTVVVLTDWCAAVGAAVHDRRMMTLLLVLVLLQLLVLLRLGRMRLQMGRLGGLQNGWMNDGTVARVGALFGRHTLMHHMRIV